MQWQFIAVLVLAIPLVLLPVAFIWYLNIGGLYGVIREWRKQSAVTGAVAGERRDEEELVGAKQ